MKLQQTIEELDKKAAQYTEAANALRIVLAQEQANNGGGSANGSKAAAKARSNGATNKVAKANKADGKKPGRKRAAVSPETRAKISAAIKERHQQRKAQAG